MWGCKYDTREEESMAHAVKKKELHRTEDQLVLSAGADNDEDDGEEDEAAAAAVVVVKDVWYPVVPPLLLVSILVRKCMVSVRVLVATRTEETSFSTDISGAGSCMVIIGAAVVIIVVAVGFIV